MIRRLFSFLVTLFRGRSRAPEENISPRFRAAAEQLLAEKKDLWERLATR
jgi:hypothetical protein